MASATSHRALPTDVRSRLWWLGALVAIEALAVVGYFVVTPAEPRAIRYLVYPFVWIDATVLAVAATSRPSASRRRFRLAVGVAVAYFVALALVSGLVGLRDPALAAIPLDFLHGSVHAHSHRYVPTGIELSLLAPGWGPRVVVVTSYAYVDLLPFRLVGYAGLAYLAFVALLDAPLGSLSGVVGLGSCVSCSFPLFASLATTVLGGSSAVVSTIAASSIDLSTVAFLLAVGLLYWRPTVGGRS